MTEQQKLEITVGMRVMVKVAAREIPATVVEVGGDWFLVRSDGTGREFRTRRVVDILDRPETDEAGIAEAAAEVASEEDATAELRREEEEGADANEADEAEGEDKPEEAKTDEQSKDEEDTKAEEQPKAGEQPKVEEDKTVDAKTEEAKSDEDKAENDKAEEQPKVEEESAKAEEPPKADDANREEPAADGGEAQEAAADARPRKNLSLVDAAIEVLRDEKRPMGAKELVRLAVERGLWIPTKAKTPDQSLYGGLYLEMKNSRSPRVRKSAEKGKFELV